MDLITWGPFQIIALPSEGWLWCLTARGILDASGKFRTLPPDHTREWPALVEKCKAKPRPARAPFLRAWAQDLLRLTGIDANRVVRHHERQRRLGSITPPVGRMIGILPHDPEARRKAMLQGGMLGTDGRWYRAEDLRVDTHTREVYAHGRGPGRTSRWEVHLEYLNRMEIE